MLKRFGKYLVTTSRSMVGIVSVSINILILLFTHRVSQRMNFQKNVFKKEVKLFVYVFGMFSSLRRSFSLNHFSDVIKIHHHNDSVSSLTVKQRC